MTSSFCARFATLLNATVDLADTFERLPGFHCLTNGTVMSWTFTDKGVGYTHDPSVRRVPATSKHEELAIQARLLEHGRTIHAFLREQGALAHGLGTITVAINEGMDATFCAVRTDSNIIAEGTTVAGGTGADVLAAKTEGFLERMRLTSIKGPSVCHTYTITSQTQARTARTTISAPDPAAAAAIYYALHDPQGFDALLEGRQTEVNAVSISQVIHPNAALLLAGMLTPCANEAAP